MDPTAAVCRYDFRDEAVSSRIVVCSLPQLAYLYAKAETCLYSGSSHILTREHLHNLGPSGRYQQDKLYKELYVTTKYKMVIFQYLQQVAI